MAWKGTYNSGTTYQNGDEVSYEIGNVDRFFIYINAASGSGHAPSDNAYWAEASLVIYNADDTILKLLIVDDNSYRTRTIMGDQQVVLYFSSPTHVEIPLGAYIIYQTVRYSLERPEALKMKHSRLFEYTVTLEAYQVRAKRWKFRNPVDGRLTFPLTATPREHLQMFVDNMNRRDSGWAIGVCIEGVEHLISYDNAYCFEALQQMSEEFGTEFEIVNKTVSLHKVEYNRNNPLSLSYGRGNGFKPNVGRSNSTDGLPVEILFAQGGEDNIDKHTYGNAALLLPISQSIGYDGEHFSDEAGYDSTRGRNYVSSADGLSIQRSDKALSSQAEDSLDCTSIYPKRVGIVGQVITVDASTNFYDFTDKNDASDPCPNYEDYLIEGETMTVRFQSGMLAGRELEVKYVHNAVTEKGVAKLARRFEIVPQEIDGVTMPNETFKPAVNDTYVVFHCSMPQAYICDNASKSGASWTMFREAVKYLYEHEEQRFSFTGTLDGLWAKKDWVNIGGRIVLGGYISFTDERFQQEAVLVRITGIKDYINNPHSPEITLSNETVTAGFSSAIKNIESNTEVIPEDNYRGSIQFTKRRFRDAQETMKMLEASLIEGFTQSISPVAAQMLQLLVGDESLQFRFVNNYSSQNPTIITPTFAYNNTTGIFSVNGGYYLQHLSLGVNTLKSSHDVSEYKWWSVQAYNSAVLDDGSKKFYLYLKCPTAASCNCEYILSETAIQMNAITGYHHFLVGVLNSEYEGVRSFTTLYGFTEITGGRITTERIVASDGNSYFDLIQEAFKLGNKLSFNVDGNGNLVLNGAFVQTGNGTVENIGAWCGLYDNARTYKLGDEVYAVVDGKTSSYRYINSVAGSGHPVTDTNYWTVFAAGVKGDKGDDGEDGQDGESIVWKGTFAAHPANPQNGWAYYNSTDKKSYTYRDGTWYQMTIDGVDGANGRDGADGISIVWKGESENPPANPQKNWCYRDTDNGYVYIYNGTAWELMTHDGSDGEDGADGDDGNSVFVTYHDNAADNPPSTPTGSGTTGGWHTTPTSASVWISQKVSASASEGTWGTPIRIKGTDGVDGADGVDGKDGTSINWRGDFEIAPPNPEEGWAYYNITDKKSYVYVKNPVLRLGSNDLRFTESGVARLSQSGYWSIMSQDGQDGQDGNDGVGIASTVIEYNTSNSGTTPPVAGWSPQIPSVAAGFYLWTRTTETLTDGTVNISYTVARQGSDGQTGAQGEIGPCLLYQGNYSSSKTYYGTSKRVDVVYYSSTSKYYVAKPTAGTIPVGTLPTNTGYWDEFGASFDSIATGTLLAEGAFLGNWRIQGGKIVSTLDASYSAKVSLDATQGKISIESSTTGGMNPEFGANILLDAINGRISINAKNAPSYSTGTAYLCPNGIFANLAGTDALPASTGITRRGAVVGLGFANVNKSEWSINADETVVAGIYGRASNNGTAPAYGGFFEKLKACGLTLGIKYVTDSSATSVITSQTTLAIGLVNSGITKTVYLPSDAQEGTVIFFKQMGAGTMRVDTYSGEYIYDDTSENSYYDVSEGETLMASKTRYSIGGVNKTIWAVGLFKY